jgi:dTDP-4-dehydrorhamnose 3,5-epimerase
VLSDVAEIQYKCTGSYSSKGESGIRWDDPDVGIQWPMPDLLLSEKDRNAQTLAEWLARPEAVNFRHEQHLAFREAS